MANNNFHLVLFPDVEFFISIQQYFVSTCDANISPGGNGFVVSCQYWACTGPMLAASAQCRPGTGT